MKRKIIFINEELCDGCGNCVPECHEGALQIIDGKARLISDLFCDGLGACIGHCPTGALTIEEREAEPYNERKVMETIVKGGQNVIKAHLSHLKDHKEFEYLTEAIDYLNDNGISIPELNVVETAPSHCPGSKSVVIEKKNSSQNDEIKRESELKQWPIQLHLVSPQAAYFKNADLLLAADCCAFSYGDFHKDFMKDKGLTIACPKLDSNKQVYLEKLVTMINVSQVNSITVLIMEVPCCGGLVQIAKQALDFSERNLQLRVVVIGINGEVLRDSIIN